mmetsp:Transcript_4827/g.9085  ORF Transcript_4827/g.9085 Transcript_4827/m.9085 type:complete len:151 (-) Transcript_4827:18-470(-)
MEEGSFNRTRVLRGWAVGAGEGAQRLLEAVSSESSRVAGLGPALFAVIFFLVIVIALCGAANFIDNPGPRKALRGAAAALIVLPVLFFASATYVNDSSQIVANRKSDETYKTRVLIILFSSFWLITAIVSFLVTSADHRQGRNVFSGKVT